MVLEQAVQRKMFNVSQSENHRKTPIFCSLTIYQNKAISTTSFLHYDVTLVLTFSKHIFKKCIKSRIQTYKTKRKMDNVICILFKTTYVSVFTH